MSGLTFVALGNVVFFLFVAAATVALFTFLSVTHWVNVRAEERKVRERYALLRKVAEQPTETAKLVLELVREEDARHEQMRRKKARRARADMLQGASVLLVTGIGLSIFLRAVAPASGVWTIGIMIDLIGVVVFAFAFFSDPDEAGRPQPS